MIHKAPSPIPGHVRVVFELPACIWADRIFLVGDFNDWDTSITPFYQGRDGIWRATVDLPGGRQYQFRYLVDGNWQTDYHADGWTVNDFGTQNSIVDAVLPVEEIRLEQASLLHEGLTELRKQRAERAEASLSPLMRMIQDRREAPKRLAS